MSIYDEAAQAFFDRRPIPPLQPPERPARERFPKPPLPILWTIDELDLPEAEQEERVSARDQYSKTLDEWCSNERMWVEYERDSGRYKILSNNPYKIRKDSVVRAVPLSEASLLLPDVGFERPPTRGPAIEPQTRVPQPEMPTVAVRDFALQRHHGNDQCKTPPNERTKDPRDAPAFDTSNESRPKARRASDSGEAAFQRRKELSASRNANTPDPYFHPLDYRDPEYDRPQPRYSNHALPVREAQAQSGATDTLPDGSSDASSARGKRYRDNSTDNTSERPFKKPSLDSDSFTIALERVLARGDPTAEEIRNRRVPHKTLKAVLPHIQKMAVSEEMYDGSPWENIRGCRELVSKTHCRREGDCGLHHELSEEVLEYIRRAPTTWNGQMKGPHLMRYMLRTRRTKLLEGGVQIPLTQLDFKVRNGIGHPE